MALRLFASQHAALCGDGPSVLPLYAASGSSARTVGCVEVGVGCNASCAQQLWAIRAVEVASSYLADLLPTAHDVPEAPLRLLLAASSSVPEAGGETLCADLDAHSAMWAEGLATFGHGHDVPVRFTPRASFGWTKTDMHRWIDIAVSTGVELSTVALFKSKLFLKACLAYRATPGSCTADVSGVSGVRLGEADVLFPVGADCTAAQMLQRSGKKERRTLPYDWMRVVNIGTVADGLGTPPGEAAADERVTLAWTQANCFETDAAGSHVYLPAYGVISSHHGSEDAFEQYARRMRRAVDAIASPATRRLVLLYMPRRADTPLTIDGTRVVDDSESCEQQVRRLSAVLHTLNPDMTVLLVIAGVWGRDDTNGCCSTVVDAALSEPSCGLLVLRVPSEGDAEEVIGSIELTEACQRNGLR